MKLILILLAICLFFSVSWLPLDKYLGGGDVGIPLLYPQKGLTAYVHSWWDFQETGSSVPTSYTAVPFYAFFSGLEYLGASTAVMQKVFFFFILTSSGLAVYALCKLWKFSNLNAFFCSLFYLCNPLTLSIWHRGIHNSMLMLSFIPVSLFVLVIGLTHKKYILAPVFGLISIFYSYVYGSPGFVVATWILWSLYLIYSWKKGDRKFVFLFSVLIIISWFLSCIWWLDLFLASSKSVFSLFTDFELRQRSSEIVVALREQSDPVFLLRLLNKYQYFTQSDWGSDYLNPIFISLSWLLPIVLFASSLFSNNQRSRLWRFAFGGFLLVVFISKGVNPPFGWLTRLVYDLVPKLAPIRNAYEKLGVVLPFLASILVILSLAKVKPKVRLIFVVLLSVIFVWPMWSGKIFSGESSKSVINFPDYYQQAANFIGVQPTGRIIHLPLAPGESVDYDWGYSGIEPNQLLFSGASIAYATGNSYQDYMHENLLLAIHTEDSDYFQKLISTLDISWLVLHAETDWRSRGAKPPDLTEKWLSTLKFLHFKKSFGPLSVYQVSGSVNPGRIYIANKLNYISSFTNSIGPEVWKSFLPNREVISTLDSPYLSSSLYLHTRNILYKPTNIQVARENALKELPHVSTLPNSPKYPLITFKESFLNLLGKTDNQIGCINLSGKRLAEAALLDQQKLPGVNLALNKFLIQLSSCSVGPENFNFWIQFDRDKYDGVQAIFARFESVLNHDFPNTETTDTLNALTSQLIKIGSRVNFLPINNTQATRHISVYTNLATGKYQVEFPAIPQTKLIKSPELVQMNDKLTSLYSNSVLDVTSDTIELHIMPAEYTKISVIPNSTIEPVKLESDANSTLELTLPTLPVRMKYHISFDYMSLLGNAPEFQVVEDSYRVGKQGRLIPKIIDKIPMNDYDHSWISKEYEYLPSPTATSAKITLTATYWNNCLGYYSENSCLDEKISSRFNRISKILISNFFVTPTVEVFPILKPLASPNQNSLGTADISFTKLSPSEYLLNLQNQNPPYLIAFSETLNSGWNLSDRSGKLLDTQHVHLNGYANGWLINSILPDKVVLKFQASRPLNHVILFTISGLAIVALFTIVLDKRS